MTYVNSAKNNINSNISNLSEDLALGFKDLNSKTTSDKNEIIGKINDISSKQDTYYNNLIQKMNDSNTDVFGKFDSVNSTLESFKNTTYSDLSTLKSTQKDISTNVSYLINAVGNATDGADKYTLFGRITRVVNGIDTINTKLDTINTNVNTIDSNIDSIIEFLRTNYGYTN